MEVIWLAVGLSLYVALLLAIAWISLHPPRTPVFISPSAIGAPQEDVEFETSGGIRLRGWWVEGASTTAATIVLCHGYVMCRSELTPLAVTLWKRGHSCLLFDFRAHGKSGGKATGLGHREIDDVAKAVAFAKARRPHAKIILIGSSMGASASCMAWPEAVDSVILDSAYSRLSDAVGGWWRFLGGAALAAVLWPCVWIAGPLAGFNPRKVDAARRLKGRDGRRVLILHGAADDLALPRDAERNSAACTPPAQIVWFEGCGHSEARWEMTERYERAVVEFIEARDREASPAP